MTIRWKTYTGTFNKEPLVLYQNDAAGYTVGLYKNISKGENVLNQWAGDLEFDTLEDAQAFVDALRKSHGAYTCGDPRMITLFHCE